MTDNKSGRTNILETEKISVLLIKFCIPSLASSLVISVYNIVDQLFIGNAIGIVGNAATNVVFPLFTLITAISLMCGVGSSAAMSMLIGSGKTEDAKKAVVAGYNLMILCGIIVSVPMLLWPEQILNLFGCTYSVMPYAKDYAVIVSLSFVFSIIGAAGPFIIRADGSPNYALLCIATGALLNVALDALFVAVLNYGIRGAGWATFLAQLVSFIMVAGYMCRFRSLKLSYKDFGFDLSLCGKLAALGAGPAFNFMTQALVQVIMNKSLRVYGATSVYGTERCLAAAGVAHKVNSFANAIVVGLTNGLQPISSYNYGCKNYERVIRASRSVIYTVLSCGFAVFLIYQFFSVEITALFGEGDELYFEFAEKFFRVFFLLICLAGLQSSVAGFFSSQGKVGKAVFISLVRQIIFFPPLLILLPRLIGINGILWAGPISDFAMAITASVLFNREIKKMEAL